MAIIRMPRGQARRASSRALAPNPISPNVSPSISWQITRGVLIPNNGPSSALAMRLELLLTTFLAKDSIHIRACSASGTPDKVPGE